MRIHGILLGICLLFAGSPAMAAFLDIYAVNGADMTPLLAGDPTYNPDTGNWDWTGWTKVSQNYSTSLKEGEWFLLGLQNKQVLNETKTVTLVYGGQPINVTDARCGYEDGTTKAWDIELQPGAGSMMEYIGTIYPQPGWEWVKLKNTSDHEVAFQLKQFTSTCTPEPGSMGLLLLGAGVILRRRR